RGPVHVVIGDDVSLIGGSYGFEPFCFDSVVHNGSAQFHTNGNAIDYLVRNPDGPRPEMLVRGQQLGRSTTTIVQARSRLRNRLVLDGPLRVHGPPALGGVCVDGGDSANYVPGV